MTDWLTRAKTEIVLLGADRAERAALIAELRQAGTDRLANQVCLARLLQASGEFHAAEQLAQSVCTAADSGVLVDPPTEIEGWIVRALSAHHVGSARDAVRHLGKAVDLAGDHNFWRPFLVCTNELLPALIDQLITADPPRSSAAAALKDRLDRRRPGTAEPETLTAPLTDRELAVLWLLPTPRNHNEIADELFISVNTVKAHVKSIYRKLGVDSRNKAIRRSRSLRLIS